MLELNRLLRASTPTSHWKKSEKWVSLLKSHSYPGKNLKSKTWTVFHGSRNYWNPHFHRTWSIIHSRNRDLATIISNVLYRSWEYKNEKNDFAFHKHSLGGADIGIQRNVMKGDRCCDRMCIVQTIKETEESRRIS